MRRRTPKYAIRNIARDMSYEERLKVLKWPTLHQRRLFSSLTECYKTANSLNELHPLEYFTFAHDFWPLRTNHRHTLKPLAAKLNSFKYSFCASIVNKWNNLPKIVAEADSEHFQEQSVSSAMWGCLFSTWRLIAGLLGFTTRENSLHLSAGCQCSNVIYILGL